MCHKLTERKKTNTKQENESENKTQLKMNETCRQTYEWKCIRNIVMYETNERIILGWSLSHS